MASYVPVVKNGASGAILYVSLVSQANTKLAQVNPTIAAGDFKVSIDGGAFANLGTLPAVTPAGGRAVKITLSQAEVNGDNIFVQCVDAAGDEWCDLLINIQTATRQIDDLAFPTTSGRSLDVTATGAAGVDWANVENQSTAVNLSGTTTNLVNTATTVTNQLTAAAIATGVWQDATAGDFTTASSIGKALYIANIAPGAAGGHFISGSNSGTTTFAALTVTGATTLTGNVAMAAGLNITQSSANTSALVITGNGTGHGAALTSGSGATGNGLTLLSAATNGHGLKSTGTGTGDGAELTAGASGADLDADIAGTITTVTTATNVTTVNGLAANVITAAATAADFGTEVAGAVWDLDATAHQTQGTFGQAIGDPAADANTIYAAVVTGAAGTTIAADIIAVKAETASILTDTAEIGAAGAGLTAINLPDQTMNITGDITGNLSGSVGSVTGAVGSVTGAVGSVAANGLTASSLAADAITEIRCIVSGTADSGSTTTMVDAARTEGDTDYWKDMAILFTSGTISGQARLITAFDAATDTITFSPATTQTVGTNTYEIIPNVAAAGASAPTAAEVADAVWDEDATAHQTQGTFGQAIGDPVADTNTIFKAVVTDATGATVGVDVVAVKAETVNILADTAEIGAAGAGLTAINLPDQTMNITGDITGNLSGSVGSVTGAVGSVTGLTASDVGAIKTKTDSLTFTVAGQADVNIQSVNDVTVTGNGQAGTEWGP